MLLQTNSYIVPKEKRSDHARLMRRFRATLSRLGCDTFEVYEQVGANWTNGETTGRYVQIMKFRDRKHQVAVQNAERTDPTAQALIAEFCELINFPYQQQQGLFAVGYYGSVLPVATQRMRAGDGEETREDTHAESADAADATDPADAPADEETAPQAAVELTDEMLAEHGHAEPAEQSDTDPTHAPGGQQ